MLCTLPALDDDLVSAYYVCDNVPLLFRQWCLCSDLCRCNLLHDLPALHVQKVFEQQQRLLPDRPSCGELQLPKLRVLDAPLGIWSQICCNSVMQQQGAG